MSSAKKKVSGKPPSGGGAPAAKDTLPAELEAALAAHPREREYFEGLPPSHRREHIQYVEEAKKGETRARRAAKVIEMLRSRGG